MLKKKKGKTSYVQVVKNYSFVAPKDNINIESIMLKLFVCFCMVACKEKESSGTFQSIFNSLLAHNNIPSIVMEGIAPLSLDSLLVSLD